MKCRQRSANALQVLLPGTASPYGIHAVLHADVAESQACCVTTGDNQRWMQRNLAKSRDGAVVFHVWLQLLKVMLFVIRIQDTKDNS